MEKAMNREPIRILLVEDNPGDARLIREMLAEAGGALFDLEWADRLSAGLERLAAGGIAVVLLDLGLPESQGLDTFARARAQAPDVPMIVLTGLDDQALALEAVGAGAQDYLVKGQVDGNPLARAIRYAIERQRAEEVLQRYNQELAALLAVARAMGHTLELDGVLNATLDEVLKLPGVDAATVHLVEEGRLPLRAHKGVPREVVALVDNEPIEGSLPATAIRSGETVSMTLDPWQLAPEIAQQADVQALVPLGFQALAFVPLKARGQVVGVMGVGSRQRRSFTSEEVDLLTSIGQQIGLGIENARLFKETCQSRDALLSMLEDLEETARQLRQKSEALGKELAERKRAEEELRKSGEQLIWSQKMEGIGTLAAGIAHDFNNILGIISGYAYLLKQGLDNPEKLNPERLSTRVEAITQAVQRGAGLAKQLLTFARKTDVRFEPLDLNDSIEDLVKMLRATFPKTIEFPLQLDQHLPVISADRSQLHQALLNICINARDAMPDGGTLSISTEPIMGARLRKRFPNVREEQYVCISIADSGIGMDESIRSRIFEPFFTTKEPGKGTGLGLAVVYGIVKNHHGFIDVESERGRGTKFLLYLPFPPSGIETLPVEAKGMGEVAGGNETILVVEDEVDLREFVKMLLEGKGYRVLTANDGEDAVTVYARHRDEIALVLSDIGLPKLGGWEAYQEMKGLNPKVKAILASGYLEPSLRSEMVQAGVKEVIQKPYVPNEILGKIREVIDSAG